MRLKAGKGKHFEDRTGKPGWDDVASQAAERRLRNKTDPTSMKRFERKTGKGDGSILEGRFRDRKSEGLSDTWRRMSTSIRKDGK